MLWRQSMFYGVNSCHFLNSHPRSPRWSRRWPTGRSPKWSRWLVWCLKRWSTRWPTRCPTSLPTWWLTRWSTWWSSTWVTRLERPKGVKDEVKQSRRAKCRAGVGGLQGSKERSRGSGVWGWESGVGSGRKGIEGILRGPRGLKKSSHTKAWDWLRLLMAVQSRQPIGSSASVYHSALWLPPWRALQLPAVQSRCLA